MLWTDSRYIPPLNLLVLDHRNPVAITTSLTVLRHVCPNLAALVTETSFHRRTTISALVSVRAADPTTRVALFKPQLAQQLVWQLPWAPLAT
jgi:hypothetical protein